MMPSQLSRIIFDNTDIWKSDMDVYIRPENIKKLSEKTGIDSEVIKKATFHSSCDYFYSQTGKTLQVKWVMPIGVGVKKKRYGLQFCPCCLIEDGSSPYFRKSWRLGFFTSCLFHSVQLHDRCPKCFNQVGLKRLRKPAGELIYHPLNIVSCLKCGFDLRNSPILFASRNELAINRINFTQYTVGHGSVENQEFQYSSLYFEGVRRLLSFLICNPKGKKLFVYLSRELNLSKRYSAGLIVKHLEPELMNIQYRRQGLLMILYFLQDWPERFLGGCKESETSTHLIYSPYLTFPYWTLEPICFLIRVLPPRVSTEEKIAIKRYLSKILGRAIKDYEIAKLLKESLKALRVQ